MKSVLRLIAGLFAIVVLVVVALAAYLAFLFDANDYRDQLVSTVKAQTGRDLTLNGPIKLSLFPWLGFSIGAAELGNAPGFSDRPFASLASAEARVKLLPLVGGNVEIDRVTMNGLQLSLERRKDGQTNWADFGQGKEAPAPESTSSSGDEDRGATGALSVGGIDVTDAAVRWTDAMAGTDYLLNQVDFSTGSIEPAEPFDFKGGFDFSVSQPAANGRLGFSGQATLDTEQQKYTLRQMRFELNAEGAGLPGGKIEAGALADVVADLNAGTLSVGNMNVKLYDLLISGGLNVEGLRDSPNYSGRIEIDGFNPRALMASMGLDAPATANAERLKRARLSANVSGTAQSMKLSNLAGSLDDSEISGSLEVANFSRQALSFDLSINQLDVDSYLPPSTAAPETAPKPGEGAGAGGATKPLDLRGPAVKGRLRVGALKVSGLNMSQVDTGVALSNGKLTLTPKAALYGGRLDADVGVLAQGKTEQLSLNGGVSGVAIGGLLRDLTAKPERLTGTGNVSMNLAGRGLGGAALRSTLDGSVRLVLKDGAVKGVNVAQFLREAQARLQGSNADTAQGAQQTDFSDMSATVSLGGGVARNSDLSLRSPLLRVSGEGQANLVKETIDYLVKASVVGTLTGQGGKSLDDVRGVTVPVRVGGTFAAPTYRLDVEALLKEAAGARLEEQKAKVKEQVDQKVEEVREKAKDQIKDELKKGLEGLFK
ncbi:AsmA family protein [Nitrogeniibacter aestuarii]|uniref:AsmA family protein n=1 Tax=Nitrogeniibacter aestuarii TaxID=2815343 RepID=UPI001E4E0BD8|nr:AsmA family protein [Nitrogeniibacter aestuarii]